MKRFFFLSIVLLSFNKIWGIENAQILDFIVPTGLKERGTTQSFQVTIQNIGDVPRSFWVGLSLATQFATGEGWPSGWYDIYPKESEILTPGETGIVIFEIEIPRNWIEGQYYATTAIWSDFDVESFIMVGLPSQESLQYDVPFDRLTWHPELTDKPDVGKQSIYLSAFDSPMALESIYGSLITEFSNATIDELYRSGLKPILFLSAKAQYSFIANGIPINISAGGVLLFDLADFCGYTPEGKEGWVTVWIASQVGALSFDFTKPIESAEPGLKVPLDAGILFQEFNYNKRGIADLKHDELQYGKLSMPGLSITAFTINENGSIKWLNTSVGGSFKRNIKFEGGIGTNNIYEFEINITALKNALLLEDLSLSFQTPNEYIDKFYKIIELYEDSPETFKRFTFDDGYWEIQNGIAERNLSMDLAENYWMNSKNCFKINIKENTTKLTLSTREGIGVPQNGYGSLRIYWRKDHPVFENNEFIYDGASGSEIGSVIDNCVITNPAPGDYYIAIPIYGDGIERYENVTFYAKVEGTSNPFPLSSGRIIYHSYSNIDAWDGKLFLLDFTDNNPVEISQNWNINNPINAHFSPDGSKIVFMGDDEGEPRDWDVYIWTIGSINPPLNLTKDQILKGYNVNEQDPKFSPDGSKVIFKQRYWDPDFGDFMYALSEMDINGTNIKTIIPFRRTQVSMPYYINSDQIIYMDDTTNLSSLNIVTTSSNDNNVLLDEPDIQEMYPIVRDDNSFLYSRWESQQNHNDDIYIADYKGNNSRASFNTFDANDSDPFPVNSDLVLFSSDRQDLSSGGWDLMLGNINTEDVWSLSEFGTNSSFDELGVTYTVHSYSNPVFNKDSIALVALFNSTNGSSWTRRDNWLTGPLNMWYGVTIENNKVISLDLSSNNLTGSLPNEIGNLVSLQTLDLQVNHLTGTIPPEIGNLSSLQGLALSTNNLTGSIPPEIGNLSNLQYLFLPLNQLSGNIPSEIGNLSKLRYLKLMVNQLNGSIPSAIGNLSNLFDLELNGNQLTGGIPPEIGNLSKLHYLRLPYNQLNGSIPPEIGNLTSLSHLDLSNNQLTGIIPPEFWILSGVQYLILNNNLLTGSIPPEIANMFGLRELDISNNLFESLPVLNTLLALQNLHIESNKFTFEDIEPNIGIPSSSFTYEPQADIGEEQTILLNIGDNCSLNVVCGGSNNQYQWYKYNNTNPYDNWIAIPGAQSDEYFISNATITDTGDYICGVTNSTASDLVIISHIFHVSVLHPTNISDSLALVALYNSTGGPNWTHHDNWLVGPLSTWYGVHLSQGRVITLDLGTNNLLGVLPPEIGNLISLDTLALGSNSLSGTIPVELFNLTTLEYLHLGNNQLTGEVSPAIGNLTNLHNLVLWYNQLSEIVPYEINNTSLRYIFLNNNLFTGLPVLDQLTNLVGLRVYNNNLTFEDIENNIGIPQAYFQYTPQINIGQDQSIQLDIGDSYTMNAFCGGINNQYQWYKDGIPIDGAQSPDYGISAAELSDAGDYTCQVTNTVATDLTIYSNPFHLSVTSNAGSQHTFLQNGWNIFSLYVTPDNTSMMSIIQPLIDNGTLVKVQNETGAAIEFVPALGIWIDNIGNWSPTESYKIKVNAPAYLNVTGTNITEPVNIGLLTGWNIVGYPSAVSQDAMDVLDALITSDNLMKVQDETGAAIEPMPFGMGWINNIGTFDPGEGYKVRVVSDDILSIDPTGTGGLKAVRPAPATPLHFKKSWEGNGYDHMNVYLSIADREESSIQPGDEIAVFDGDLCVGAAKIGDLDLFSLILTADDPTSDAKDGFTEGNPMTFRIWNHNMNSETLISSIEFLNGYYGVFESMGTTAAVLGIGNTETGAGITSLGDNYPNPFNLETTIPFTIGEKAKVDLSIYDVLGQRLATLVNSIKEAGTYEIVWDGSDNRQEKLKPGIYFCRLVAGNKVLVKTMEVID